MLHQEGDDIRMHLLQSLGIFQFVLPKHLRRAIRTSDHPADPDHSSHPEISRDLANQSSQEGLLQLVLIHKRSPPRIQFHPDVRVYEIPSRTEYSDDDKKLIWRNKAELRKLTQRNRREFSFENWDWHQVLEEKDMYYDKTSKLYIHPVHLCGITRSLIRRTNNN